ncbi:hypothetical protein Q8A67_005673, partial [Cirrhinus molitorella]
MFGAKTNEIQSVSVTEGDSVLLPTNVNQIADNDRIVWLFEYENSVIAKIKRKKQIFTTYDDVHDGRFRDRLKLDNQTGSLTITNTKTEHTGRYKLQIWVEKMILKTFSVSIYGVFGAETNEILSVSVMEGDSVTLKSNVTELREDDDILWKFGTEKSLIARIDREAKISSTYNGTDGRFKDRLKLDNQTGSLTITNTTTEHAGLYELQRSGVKLLSKLFSVSVYVTLKLFIKLTNPSVGNYNVIFMLLMTTSGMYFLYRSSFHQYKYLSVMEGESVTLKTNVTEIREGDDILWNYGAENSPIAKMVKSTQIVSTYNNTDERFRDRLKLDNQTGSLTITNITTKHTGVYQLEISGENLISEKFCFMSVMEGDSVTLNTEFTEIPEDDDILWNFGAKNSMIAQIIKNYQIFNKYDDVPDGRFRDRLKLDNQTGSLTITNITIEHAGDYKLEIAGVKKSSKTFSVSVYGVFGATTNEIISVIEGDSVTLHTDGIGKHGDDDLLWKFGAEKSQIAIIKKMKIFTSDGPDRRFRDRLKLDNQTGSLTIMNITTKHAGLYKLEISGDVWSSKTFGVSVYGVFGESVSVMEGDSVTLNSDVTEIHEDDDILWKFGSEDSLIAEISGEDQISRFDGPDGRFRHRLKLDKQTASLTITNITTEHAGLYELQISGDKLSSKTFSVSVYGVFGESLSVMEGNSVTLNTDLTEIREDDDILWKFGAKNSLIGQISIEKQVFSTFDGPDGRFRDRLKLGNQTGSLTITNITTEHDGHYELEIDGPRWSTKTFSVSVYGVSGETVSVIESDSVTLRTDFTEIRKDDDILWKFGAETSLIAEVSRAAGIFSTYSGADGRFRDRLKLDEQTGSLTIINITTEHAGLYEVQRSGAKWSSKTFSVSVYVSVIESDSVTLRTDIAEIREDDDILWKFGAETSLIAEISRAAGIFSTYNGTDGRFRDRLKLDNQTGSLTIINITTEHAGLYEVQRSGVKWSSKTFSVSVYGEDFGDFFSWSDQTSQAVKPAKTSYFQLNSQDQPGFSCFFFFQQGVESSYFDVLETSEGSEGPDSMDILERTNEILSVTEGDSVALLTATEIFNDEDILWYFGVKKSLVAKINRESQTSFTFDDVLDGRFRDRLKLDNQTGSLTITNITTQHAGDYKLEISGAKLQSKTVSVFVYGVFANSVSGTEGDSVTLNSDVAKIRDDEDILWKFGAEKSLISEISKAAGISSTFYVPDERFRDRLKLDHQTGSLTIMNITDEHAGVYQLVISGAKLLSKNFSVSVYAQIAREKQIFPDGRFRDKLKLDRQTGSLTITNITTEHAGRYELKISGINRSTKTFSVSVYVGFDSTSGHQRTLSDKFRSGPSFIVDFCCCWIYVDCCFSRDVLHLQETKKNSPEQGGRQN